MCWNICLLYFGKRFRKIPICFSLRKPLLLYCLAKPCSSAESSLLKPTLLSSAVCPRFFSCAVCLLLSSTRALSCAASLLWISALMSGSVQTLPFTVTVGIGFFFGIFTSLLLTPSVTSREGILQTLG